MFKHTNKKSHMVQKLFASVLASVLLVQGGSQGLIVSAAENGPEIFVQTEEQASVFDGGVVRVPIHIDQNPGIAAYEVALVLPEELMPYVTEIQFGEMFAGGMFPPMANLTYAENTVWFSYLSLTDIGANGLLADLLLDLEADIPVGQYPITVEVKNLMKSNITAVANYTVTDGVINIGMDVVGDLNGDNAITMDDFMLLYAHYGKSNILPDELLEKADVNLDGKIDMVDVMTMQQAVAGQIDLPADKTLQIVSEDEAVALSEEVAAAAVTLLQPLRFRAASDKTVSVPVNVENNDGLASFHFDMYYDNTALKPVGYTLGTVWSGSTLVNLEAGDDYVKVLGVDLENFDFDGSVVNIVFEKLDPAAVTDAIELDVVELVKMNDDAMEMIDNYDTDGTSIVFE